MSERDETEPAEGETARLESLFEAWDARKDQALAGAAAEAEEMAAITRAWTMDPSRLWGTLALLVMGLSVWIITLVWADVQYWALGDDSLMELGDVGELWAEGARKLEAPSNRYVAMSGLFVTMESEGERDTAKVGEREVVSRFYLCPLYDIAVRTDQPFVTKSVRRQWSLEIDGRFAELLVKRRAFPSDLTVTAAVQGRLLRDGDVPYWHSDPLIYFQRVSGIPAREMWLMLDGSRPSDHRTSALVFLVALLLALGGGTVVVRGWIRRRRLG